MLLVQCECPQGLNGLKPSSRDQAFRNLTLEDGSTTPLIYRTDGSPSSFFDGGQPGPKMTHLV
jgi:hypothetical protein